LVAGLRIVEREIMKLKIPSRHLHGKTHSGEYEIEIGDVAIEGIVKMAARAYWEPLNEIEINRDQAQQIVDHLTRVFSLEKKA